MFHVELFISWFNYWCST